MQPPPRTGSAPPGSLQQVSIDLWTVLRPLRCAAAFAVHLDALPTGPCAKWCTRTEGPSNSLSLRSYLTTEHCARRVSRQRCGCHLLTHYTVSTHSPREGTPVGPTRSIMGCCDKTDLTVLSQTLLRLTALLMHC
jgi:hypothetical protein